MNFADAIKPLEVDAFLDTYVGRLCWHQQAASDRYSSRLPWIALNEAVNQWRLSASATLAVYDQGAVVDPSRFLVGGDYDNGGTIDSGRLQGCLAGGAVLVVNQVDEVFPFIAELSRTAEQTLRARTRAMLCVSWRQQKTVDPQPKDHDLLILLLDGVGSGNSGAWIPEILAG